MVTLELIYGQSVSTNKSDVKTKKILVVFTGKQCTYVNFFYQREIFSNLLN